MASTLDDSLTELISKLKFSESAKILTDGLLRIRKEFIRRSDGVERFRQLGGLKPLLNLVKKPNDQIVDISLSILANCCLEEETRRQINVLKGIPVIVCILKSLKSNSILNRASRALANLAINQDIAEEIHKEETPVILVKLLKDSEDDECRQSLIRALRNLSKTDEHRKQVVEAEGLETIAELLKCKHSGVATASVRAVAEITKNCSLECARQVVHSDGFEVLVRMVCHPKTVIREHAVMSLFHLMTHPVVRPFVGSAGGIKTFINDIKRSTSTMTQSIQLLCLCCRDVNNRVAIRDANGLELLLEMLKSSEYSSHHERIIASFLCFIYDEPSLEVMITNDVVSILLTHLRESVTPSKLSLDIEYEDQEEEKTKRNEPEEVESNVKPFILIDDSDTTNASGEFLTPQNNRKCPSGLIVDSPVSSPLLSTDLATSSNYSPYLSPPMSDHGSDTYSLSPPHPCMSSPLWSPQGSIASIYSDTSSLDGGFLPCMSPVSFNDEGSTIQDSLDLSCVSSMEQQGNDEVDNENDVYLQTTDNMGIEADDKDNKANDPDDSENVVYTEANGKTANEADGDEYGITEADNIENTVTENEVNEADDCEDEVENDNNEELQSDKVAIKSAQSAGAVLSNQDSPLKTFQLVNVDMIQTGHIPDSHCEVMYCVKESQSSDLDIGEIQDKCNDDSPKQAKNVVHNILLFLSRISQMEDPSSVLVTENYLTSLLEYTSTVADMSNRAVRILTRLTRNPHCFEAMILNNAPSKIHLILAAAKENESSQTKQWEQIAELLMKNLGIQAETPYGQGVMAHSLLSKSHKEKLAAAMAVPYVYSNCSQRRKMLLELNGLEILLESIKVKDETTVSLVIGSLSHLANTIGITPPIVPKIPQRSKTHTCYYNEQQSSFDVMFIIEDTKIPANKQKLSEECTFFSAMLVGAYKEAKQTEININQVSPQAFSFLMHHLYGCLLDSCSTMWRLLDTTQDNLELELVACSDRFIVPSLFHTVHDVVLFTHMNLNSLVQLYVFCSTHHSHLLCQECLEYLVCQKTNFHLRVAMFKEIFRCQGNESVCEEISLLLKKYL
ncbi:uncharacterized protein LOC102807296 [Saccoglossus kowalevskii]|uniref:Armadillo repeat-containing protein 5-like n=1 Tax=Saccoglossus kowalevskii TaxID=10224 RepID=A0ABM0LW45_SACKO|nr:PREDICTED: armadillo repeat-containing protein 5-like [Saccoglossus kowalevskii]